MPSAPPDSSPVAAPVDARRRRPASALPFQRMGAVKSVAGALAATGALIGPAYALRMGRGHSGSLPMLWHRAISRALGVRSSVLGTIESGSVLYVLNHLSWLDIPVVGSHLQGAFVAKSEVGDMGMVGFLADIQRTIYVERERRHRSADQAGEIARRLRAGENVILFPEGTSNDGVRILPFKSSLFSVVEGAGTDALRIQPLTLAYTHLNGLPITRNRLIELAWIGDMDLAPHALDCMRLGRIEARLLAHAPVRRSDFADRKALTRHCQAVIADGYRHLLRGIH